MAGHIHRCNACNAYTLKDTCANCGQKTILPRPPKYSTEDRYAGYRRKLKMETLHKEGLI